MLIKSSLVILVLSIFVMSNLETKNPAKEDFEAKIFNDAEGNFLRYRIHYPDVVDGNNKYPLILFFHGSGERGEDNTKQLLFGVHNILEISKEINEPTIIIAPQLPLNKQWVDMPWDTDFHIMPKQPSLFMTLTIALLKDTLSNLPIDIKRIYITGLSMGGFGTWDILQRMPDTFAAAIPVCGGGDINHAEKIKGIPIWAFHGEMDTVVKTKLSRDMIASLKQAGGKPNYTEYKGVGHDSWTATYSDKSVVRWLFMQKKI